MKKIRLVLCDIDGTLVTTGQPMGEKTKEVIDRLHAHGVLFGIASGRSVHQQLSKQAKAWGFDWPFDVLIGMNGSELWDEIEQKRSDYYQLSKETIKEIVGDNKITLSDEDSYMMVTISKKENGDPEVKVEILQE